MVVAPSAAPSAIAARRSRAVTAQMRHWSCVRITSGRSARSSSLKMWYTGPPRASCARTASSIAADGAAGSTLGAVSGGTASAAGGQSQPWLRPTSRSPHPSAYTISVVALSSETTRGGASDMLVLCF